MSQSTQHTVSQTMQRVEERVEDSAVTKYKHRLDARHPVRERDLAHPSRASLTGSVWTKFLLFLMISGFLIMHSLGYDGSTPNPDALSFKMIVSDLSIGASFFGLVSVFTYCYLRLKNQAICVVLFIAMVVVMIIALLVWSHWAATGGRLIFPIILIIVCLIPFVMDIWGLITYGSNSGK